MEQRGADKMATIEEYVEILSSAAPAPGGGSAAAITTSIAISLGLMSINVSKKRKSYAEKHPEDERKRVDQIIDWLYRLQKEALEYEKKDEEAFNNFMKVYKTGTEKEKEEASFRCYNVPYLLLELNMRAVNLIMALKPYVVASIVSDYKMALELLKATMHSCLLNMDINLDGINDEDIKKDCESSHKQVEELIKKMEE